MSAVTSALRASVLRDPWSNLSRYMPMLRETATDLRELGLWGHEQGSFTDTGRVANLLAREINPRRAYYRTVEWLAHGLKPLVAGEPIDDRISRVETALDTLNALRIAEPDDDYNGRAPAWRLFRT